MRAPRKVNEPQHGHDFWWYPPNQEWLYDQYVTKGKTIEAVAREIGASKQTVHKWLIEVGIARRGHQPEGSSEGFYREQARRTLEAAGVPKVCAKCKGSAPLWFIEVHHLDEDITNNKVENLQYLCRGCHLKIHWKARRGGRRDRDSVR